MAEAIPMILIAAGAGYSAYQTGEQTKTGKKQLSLVEEQAKKAEEEARRVEAEQARAEAQAGMRSRRWRMRSTDRQRSEALLATGVGVGTVSGGTGAIGG